MKKLLLLICILTFANAQSKWSVISTVPTSPVVNSITVVNSGLIWICTTGGKVYRSTDSGVTWVLRNGGLPAVDLYGISAIDTTNCWVGTVAGSIYRTSNGGSNWTLQLTVAGSFTNGIKMFDLNYGIYYGDPTGAGQPYQFRFTTNGGTAWTLSPGAPIAGNEFGVINAWDWIDTGKVWIGSANINASPTTANVYRTASGFRGGSWLTVSLTGNGGTAGLYYQAIGFNNANNGLAGSNGSNMRKTTDGGATWTVATNPGGILSYAAINMNGLKDGSNIIRASINTGTTYSSYRTTNLGSSWTNEPLPALGITNGIQHMQFVNSALGYSGGNAGTFMKYESINANMKIIIQGLYNSSSDKLSLTDTVRTYLRNSTSPYAVVDSSIALVDSSSLTGYFIFDNAGSGTYYIQVKYRSGLETWSKTGGEAYTTGNTYSYDFTSSASQAFGNNMPQVDASPLRFGIYSGDVNQDGIIDLTDVVSVNNSATFFTTGYVVNDVNADFIVDLTDIIITNNNSSIFVQKITP